MAETRRARLVLFTDGSSKMRALKLTRFRVIFIAFSIVALFGLITYSVSRFLSQRFVNIAMSEALAENSDLRENLSSVRERLNEIDGQLTLLAESDDYLRVLADIPRIDKDIREVGVGGVEVPGIDYSDKDKLVSKLIFDIDKLEREIRLQQQSFLEIRRQFADKAELLQHTPSIRPLKGCYISSGFGRRRDPFSRRWVHHSGIDFAGERGTPVHATADGEVMFAKRAHGMGKVIIIDHGFGYRTAYGHLDMFSVARGQKISRGQKIGELGNTGRSTGPHLHYEVHVDKKAVDPRDYFFEAYADITKIE